MAVICGGKNILCKSDGLYSLPVVFRRELFFFQKEVLLKQQRIAKKNRNLSASVFPIQLCFHFIPLGIF